MVNYSTWQHGFSLVFDFIHSAKRKKENVITDEIAVIHLLPKSIVLKSKNDLIPLTRLLPFVIEKRAVLEELKK